MKKLKANKITFYSSIDELKKSIIDNPFDEDKHNNYIKKLKDFQRKINSLKK